MINFETQNLTAFLEGLQGYKMKDVHFAGGSQYHTDTFFHARVLLQNSYYTSRIALLLADKIAGCCNNAEVQNITLVGYERYSELLLGLITNYLRSMEKGPTVSTCIMAEDNGMRTVVLGGKPYKDYIIIVPIISTGSTTKRIEEAYKQEYQGKKCIGHFHVMRICPSEEKTDDTLLNIKVIWRELHECQLCFNDRLSKPLFVADKTQLNPIAIFEGPETKDTFVLNGDEWKKRASKIKTGEAVSVYGCEFKEARFNDSLQYHVDKNFEDFREFSHLTGKFIESNLEGINDWLDDLKDEFLMKPSDRVFVLSPCHVMTNVSFVNLVNERLFDSSATIVYLEPSKEYSENFRREYKSRFKDSIPGERVKIFYVDDDLVSGNSFFSIYDLFRDATHYDASLTGAIFLMNKATPSVDNRVKRASRALHSYVSINMPQHYMVSEEVPYDREIHRYDNIIERCLYYEPEIAFSLKRDSLCKLSENMEHKSRHLEMFYATHVLYDIFSDSNIDLSNLSFGGLLRECKKRHNGIKDEYAVLKVLTTNSFTMYKPIREKVFAWVKTIVGKLEKQIDRSCKEKKNWDEERVLELEHLSFMIHRSVMVGNLHIVSKKFFALLSRVFDSIRGDGVTYSVKSVDGIEKKTALKGYHEDILKRYVELISSRPAVAVKIKESLEQKGLFTSQYGKWFKDTLLDETCVVINDLYAYVSSMGFPHYAIFNSEGLIEYERYVNIIEDWFDLDSRKDSSTYKIADMVVGNGDGSLSPEFLQYLWVKSYIKADLESKLPTNEMVEKKSVQLCSHLKSIVCRDKRVGAFFIVTDVLNNYRLVYDEDDRGYAVLGNHFRDSNLLDFFKAIGEDSVNSDRRIVLQYQRGSPAGKAFFDIVSNNVTVLKVYRIGKVGESTISGIIGFYSSSPKRFKPAGHSYILLLRRDIIRFIDHHHRNEEFIQSVLEEEKRKFAYLTGHGREMMLKLSYDSKDMVQPIVTTMERLQGVFAGSQDDKGSREQMDLFFPKEKIDEAYIIGKYDDSSSKKVKPGLTDELTSLAKLIYKSDIVEWKDDCSLKKSEVNCEPGATVSFNYALIKFICFELIINAKKNRFYYSTEAFDTAYPARDVVRDRNSLQFKISLTKDGLVITVIGTGPAVDDSILESIENQGDIKGKEDISGLDLIRKLIKFYNSQNRLKMTSETLEGKPENYPVKLNSVSVIIH